MVVGAGKGIECPGELVDRRIVDEAPEGVLVPEAAGAARRLTALFLVLLPLLVYTFLSALWLIRTIAESGLARR